MKPFVGLPAATMDVCAYSADIDQPGCTNPAVLHIISDSPGWGLVGLSTCDAHLAIARAAGFVIAEHGPSDPGCRCG